MKLKTISFLIPEIYLIGATLYYWILTANLFNPFAIILLIILIFQAIYKKTITGLIISTIFIAINLFLVLALFSELTEFDQANNNFMTLLVTGSIFIGLNICFSLYMFIKYINRRLQLENPMLN